MRQALASTIKTVVIPLEHGATVMLCESLAAGLWISMSWTGIWPALGWVFLYAMSHPLKIAVKDIRYGLLNNRTKIALAFCGGFGILSAVFFGMTYFFCGPPFLLVFAAVIPLGLIYLGAVFSIGKKELTAEISGAISLGASGASIVISAKSLWMLAITLWLVLSLRAVTSIVYVRERLRFARGHESNFNSVLFVHIAGLFILGGLVFLHIVKAIILIGWFVLMTRALWIKHPCSTTAKQLGIQESVFGIIFVILTVMAF